MELSELGLDDALAQQASCALGLRLARVTAVDRGRYVVRSEQDEVPAELTGRFLHTAGSSVDMPCVGDCNERGSASQLLLIPLAFISLPARMTVFSSYSVTFHARTNH